MSSARPRMLIVFPCTVSGYAGNIARVRQMFETFRARYELHFLSLVQPPGVVARELRAKGLDPDHVGLVGAGALEWALRFSYRAVYILNRLLVEKLGWADRYRFWAFDRVARLLIAITGARSRYDAALMNYVWIARGLATLARTFAVDLHDIHADRHARLGYRDWVTLSTADEVERIRESPAAIAISETEWRHLEARDPSSRVHFLPYFPPGRSAADGELRDPSCAFVGSGNALNVGTLEHAERMGVFRALQRNGFRLRLAGDVCEAAFARELSRRWPGMVEFHGRVTDLQRFLRGCSVGLNTCGPSTGIKVKTVDYLQAGLRVIATPFGSDAWLERVYPSRIEVVELDDPEAARRVDSMLRSVARGEAPRASVAEREIAALEAELLAWVERELAQPTPGRRGRAAPDAVEQDRDRQGSCGT